MAERFTEKRDVEAGLVLLQYMLRGNIPVLDTVRLERLLVLKKGLELSRRITSEQRLQIVKSYREVIG